MAGAQKFLGVQKPIRQLCGDEWRQQRADGRDGEQHPRLLRRQMPMLGHEREEERQPSAPNRELQKHHYRELDSQAGWQRRGLVRNTRRGP